MNAIKVIAVILGVVIGMFLLVLTALFLFFYFTAEEPQPEAQPEPIIEVVPEPEPEPPPPPPIHEGGVRTGDNLEEYAITALKENKILDNVDDIIVYFDASEDLDGSNVKILTSTQLIAHTSKKTLYFDLHKIRKIAHKEDDTFGSMIKILFDGGKTYKFLIDPGADHTLFKEKLLERWRTARGE